MMATANPPGYSGFLPLLESLEDSAAGQSSQTDAYLTIATRLSGEEGRQFLPAVEKHFSRLGKIILAHIISTNVELSQAALQALGFCVYHSNVVSGATETLAEEILSALCSLVMKSADKNTCTRSLWVISKQNFPSKVVATKVPSVLSALESVWSREDIQSVVMEHEALNVIIRLLEQVPVQMGEGTVRWAKLIIPLVVHSASKVRLRAAAAMEMGMPLLLKKQIQVAAIIEPLMSTKLIPELQKLFVPKNETNVLKLWSLFVRLLGKLLHKGGPFINSLLHLEELGFRSSSPTIKKIAFLAWKSLIDNFALNPDILCSSKRLKLLMQPLSSINVKTEPLQLTKVEVWWYLVVQLGPNLAPNFDSVSVPLLQSTIGCESVSVPGTPSRGGIPTGGPNTPKSAALNTSVTTPRMSLNSSISGQSVFPSIQLLGLEMLLHYFMGPEVIAPAEKNRLNLSLEPLKHPFLSGTSSFTKHAAVLIAYVRDGVIEIGKDAPEPLLTLLWTSLVQYVNCSIESVGSKKDRQGCEVLTFTLQALQSIVSSEALPSQKVLFLIEATVKGISPRVLGSASYQVGKMDVLNGTPALFLIQLLYDSSMLSAYVEDERFIQCLQTLVGCGLSGPTSPLAFGEAVLSAINRSSGTIQNKEQLWKMWSVVVSSLTDTVAHSNEVNQGDALEHNFSAMYSALMFPITHLLHDSTLQQASQKSMLSMWSKLYQVFARCSALVVTAEENICCEELCTKMAAALDKDTLMVPSTLNVILNILQVIVECVDFTPYTPHFQQKIKSPHTPVNWMKKRTKVLGNLSTFQSLVVQCLNVFLDTCETSSGSTGAALVSVLATLFTNLVLANAVHELLTAVVQPLSQLYKQAATEPAKFTSQFVTKLEKLLSEVLSCLQSRSTLAYNTELLELLCPLLCVLFSHKNKHLRTTVTQFWNASFANSVSLIYPEEIKPVLSQVKKKTPIILPGFEVVSVPDELCGQESSECSQLETKLSGIPISVGKRDSLLGKTPEAKDQTSSRTSKLVSTKLDFGSPKPARRIVLEEEASVDFVFIPPETKERVLTAHQKEVKQTKRVDIPAMYNNLDASLDTTVFTQYTQSQEDYGDTLPAEQVGEVSKDDKASMKASTTEPTNGAGETEEVVAMETQDFASPKAELEVLKSSDGDQQDEVVPESTDVSMEEGVQKEETSKEANSQANDSQNMSSANDSQNMSSDFLSGTPQKSRRQSFITLEMYAESKLSSPSSGFTGQVIQASKGKKISPSTPRTTDSSTTQDLQTEKEKTSDDGTPESPRLPKDGKEMKGVKLIDRLPSDTTEEEDMIPDTQTEMQTKAKSYSQESQSPQQEESDVDSPRRSSRPRVRPLLPGEDPEERDEKFAQLKRKPSAGDVKADSPTSSVKVRRNTRSKSVEDDGSKERLRTRSQKEKELSQTNSTRKKIKLFSSSQDYMDKPAKRKSLRESSQTDLDSQSENESQSMRRSLHRSKLTPDVEMDDKLKYKTATKKAELSANETESQLEEENDSKPQSSPDSLAVVGIKEMVSNLQPSPSATPDCLAVENVELEKGVAKSSQSDCTQVNVLNDFNAKDPPSDGSEPLQVNSQRTRAKSEPQTEMQMAEELSQDSPDSQSISSSESQTRRRSRRSKALSDSAETKTPEDQGKRSKTSSQADTKTNVKTRRSKGQEDSAKSSSTPDNAQSQDSLQSLDSESSQGRSRRSSRRNSALPEQKSESQTSEKSDSTVKRKGRPRRILPALSPLDANVKEDKSRDDLSNANLEASQMDNSQIIAIENSENTGKNEESAISELKTNETNAKVVESDVEKYLCIENLVSKKDQDLPCNIEEQQMDSEVANLDSSQQCSHLDMVENIASVETEEEPEEKTKLPTEETQSPVKEDICASLDVAAEAVNEAEEEQTHLNENLSDSEAEIGAQDNETGAECLCAPSDPAAVELSEEEETKTVGSQGQPLEVIEGITPIQDNLEDNVQIMASEEKTEDHVVEQSEGLEMTRTTDAAGEVLSATTADHSPPASPVKQMDLEAIIGPEVGQSPVSRAKGTWSPTASPSTSILKKAQKRALEVETPSPLVKSRRVSFADPIQHQELADDIDRRSPALRTSSPRRTKMGVGSIPQPKFVTTPTKGLITLSPRNLNSPGYKSSKKCLISELGQEPRPVSKDCIYPALVGCTAPVEAVLPQIASTMWSRGFGQIVRARNIKTVGDLSALTPPEVKVLPIRSPKVSNVKKALKIYEQQRKGRGGDELKSFDEMERMTSEVEESSAAQNQDEDQKTPASDALATELVFDAVSAEEKMEQDSFVTADTSGASSVTADPSSAAQTSDDQVPSTLLLSELEFLHSRTSPEELCHCSPQQLLLMHQQLADMMKTVVLEMNSRLSKHSQSQ
ncbi:telomere-associated protein RIF1 [Eucyclogobius newberryi]|uniref:telomere-associated protein RIF1 n=1 Tax=Eucyclogobius newberryi TaxID=166745 RepID=UPI003B59057A